MATVGKLARHRKAINSFGMTRNAIHKYNLSQNKCEQSNLINNCLSLEKMNQICCHSISLSV